MHLRTGRSATPRSAQYLVEQLVRLLAHGVGEVVIAVGVLDAQVAGLAVQIEHLLGRGGDAVDTVGAEVAVVQRSFQRV